MLLSDLKSELDELLACKDDFESDYQDWKDSEPYMSDADSCEDYEYAKRLWIEDKPIVYDYYDPDELEKVQSVIEAVESYNCDDDPELVSYDDFVDRVRDLCSDLGYVGDDFLWWISIDWEEPADNVKCDYFLVEYNGNGYWVRIC